jgi:alpha-1,3-rhamnosyl/mannosyltransferase
MRVIGCAEVAGGAALLAEAGDDVALAANLAQLVDETDARARCIARGRARAAELSWERAARAYAALVRSLVA